MAAINDGSQGSKDIKTQIHIFNPQPFRLVIQDGEMGISLPPSVAEDEASLPPSVASSEENESDIKLPSDVDMEQGGSDTDSDACYIFDEPDYDLDEITIMPIGSCIETVPTPDQVEHLRGVHQMAEFFHRRGYFQLETHEGFMGISALTSSLAGTYRIHACRGSGSDC